MARFKIGVHLRPQHTTIEALHTAWKAADALGVDSISVWDHFLRDEIPVLETVFERVARTGARRSPVSFPCAAIAFGNVRRASSWTSVVLYGPLR